MTKTQVMVYLDGNEMSFLEEKVDEGFKLSSYIRYLIKKEMKNKRK
jgi:hypothetical protein